jgi:lipoprotein-anchoring transpeptidase ErfK/SrfK
MLLPLVLAQVSSEVATMRENSRRQLKKAAKKLLIFLSLMALMMVPGSSQMMPAATLAGTPGPKVAPGTDATAEPKRFVLVSIPDRKLALLEDGNAVKVYRVAVGSSNSPSPSGEFAIINRITNPTYYHPHVVIPASEDSPIGTRWVGLNHKGYGIHGTNEPRSIGRAASHGCIRMSNRDIAQFQSGADRGPGGDPRRARCGYGPGVWKRSGNDAGFSRDPAGGRAVRGSSWRTQ